MISTIEKKSQVFPTDVGDTSSLALEPSVSNPGVMPELQQEFRIGNSSSSDSALSFNGTISRNQARIGSLTRADGNNPLRNGRFADDYQLSGVRSGERVQIDLTSGQFDTYLQVVDRRTGRLIFQNDDRGFSTNSQLTIDVSSGADYLVRVTSYGTGATGRYTLATSGNGISLTSISGNQIRSGYLTPEMGLSLRGDGLNPWRVGSYADDYALTGVSGGQQVRINLDSSRFDPYLQVLNRRTGEVIASNDDGGPGTNSQLTFTAQSGVNYLLRATTFRREAFGGYTIRTYTDPGNTLRSAEIRPSARFARSERVDTRDADDFYRFYVSSSGIFTANLTHLSGDADVRLIRDVNNNGQIDLGEIRAWQWERGTRNESIRDFLERGTYFAQVTSHNNQTANYRLSTNFTPAARDNRRFSIQTNLGSGLTGLNAAARNAILQAARTWEGVISHSTFNGDHIVRINISGTNMNNPDGTPNRSTLATAGWRNVQRDANGRWMPVTGVSTINTRFLNRYNSDPAYLRSVMTHEFGHVLGIGTLWETRGRNFVNRSRGTYNANTYAGWVYGGVLGTNRQAAVPVTHGVRAGSDWSHWDEGTFDTELMTHQSEGSGRVATPLSQLTVASLRDIGWNVNYGGAQPWMRVTIQRVRALDTFDEWAWFSARRADFYPRVGINGQYYRRGEISNDNDITPNWTFNQGVNNYNVPINIQIWDSDVDDDDSADINRFGGNNRRLGLTYNTLTGRFTGSGLSGRNGQLIYSRGFGNDSAEIWFRIAHM